MTSIKQALLALAAAAALPMAPALAQTPAAPPPAPNWKTPTLESCLNLEVENLKRTPGCTVLLSAQNMEEAEQAKMHLCLSRSAEARAADPTCQAIWQKYPAIVKLRKAA